MKKEEIYVVIDTEEKRLKALEILEKTGEHIWEGSCLTQNKADGSRMVWAITGWQYGVKGGEKKITLEQLEQLLTLDQLKQQAEALGFELVEKKRVPKVGDFGVFGEYSTLFGFISEIDNNNFADSHGSIWDNFRHLTEEEKQNIQNNW